MMKKGEEQKSIKAKLEAFKAVCASLTTLTAEERQQVLAAPDEHPKSIAKLEAFKAACASLTAEERQQVLAAVVALYSE